MDLFKTAVILAGGKSSRMGFDKQFLRIHNQRLMDHLIENLRKEFEEIIIVSNKVNEYQECEYKDRNVKVICDEIKEKGPLGGLHAGLKNSSSSYIYLTACDMPDINLDYIRFMKERIKVLSIDACVTSKEGRIEPFHAFYSANLVETIEQMFEEGYSSLASFIKKVNSLYIREEITRQFCPDWSMFYNLNTAGDIDSYLSKELKERDHD